MAAMRQFSIRPALRAFLVPLSLIAMPAGALSPPAGWSRTQSGAVESFQPGNLAAGEVFTIAVHPAATTRGQPLNAWLDAWAADKVPGTPSGKVLSEADNNGQSATGQVMFRDAKGSSLVAMFVAVSLNGDRVRAMRIVATPDAALFARQKPALGEFVKLLATDEAAAYRAAQPAPVPAPSGSGYVEKRSTDARAALANAGVPAGSRAGGPFRHGTYEFELPLPAINDVRRYRISFYENGEWRKGEGTSEETSKFTYDPDNGALNISVTMNLYNSSYDETDFCRFYVAPDGRPYIYAEDEYGVGTHRITGRYVGPNTRPSPTDEKTAKAAAKAEANRFKWVTAPGKGLPMEHIAGVLHQLEQVYEIGGLQLHEYTYLLLRDGTAYRNLRCPPDQLDVAASRRNEPRQWGRWRKAGSKYELQFTKADGSFEAWKTPSMTSLVRPGARGERLQGRYQSSSSYQIPGGAGSVSFRGISFTSDGRFETDFYSITGGSTGFGDQRITTGAVANDEGSVSSVSGPNFGGGSSRKSNRPKSERTGRYEIDGYTLSLQFDDGRTERLPFFFAYSGKKDIWFRDAVYSIPKKD
jgi:hypothetical protein